MSWVICTACGQEFHWRAQRGMRLAGVLSPCCKSPGRGKTAGIARPQSQWKTVRMRVRRINSLGGNDPFRKEFVVTAKFRQDGELQLGRWYTHLRPTECVQDGWRLLAATQYLTYYVNEEDYQRLLAKCNGDGRETSNATT